jgi:hypothetical protein
MRKIDEFLKTRIYQPLVDVTEKHPAKIAKICLQFGVLWYIIRVFLSDQSINWFDWLSSLVLLVSAVIVELISDENLKRMHSEEFIRWFRIYIMLPNTIFLLVLSVAVVLLIGPTFLLLDYPIPSLMYLSFYYFADCDLPKPKKKTFSKLAENL